MQLYALWRPFDVFAGRRTVNTQLVFSNSRVAPKRNVVLQGGQTLSVVPMLEVY